MITLFPLIPILENVLLWGSAFRLRGVESLVGG